MKTLAFSFFALIFSMICLGINIYLYLEIASR